MLEQGVGLLHVAGGVLLQAELGHLVDEFGVKVALLAGLGLIDFGFKRGDAFLVGGLLRQGRTQRPELATAETRTRIQTTPDTA